jgi:hypothetical protein
MAQHEQLKVLDLDAPTTAKQQLQQRNERQVDERQDHRTILSAPATPELPGRSRFWHPSGREAELPAPRHAFLVTSSPTPILTNTNTDTAILNERVAQQQTLFDGGRGQSVIQQRMEFQDLMRARFEAVIRDATGRRVIGFMSGNQQDRTSCARSSSSRRPTLSTITNSRLSHRVGDRLKTPSLTCAECGVL